MGWLTLQYGVCVDAHRWLCRGLQWSHTPLLSRVWSAPCGLGFGGLSGRHPRHRFVVLRLVGPVPRSADLCAPGIKQLSVFPPRRERALPSNGESLPLAGCLALCLAMSSSEGYRPDLAPGLGKTAWARTVSGGVRCLLQSGRLLDGGVGWGDASYFR